MSHILDKINFPEDLNGLSLKEIELLAEEIRKFLVLKVSVSGGHLASNLGVVELTLALHSVFNTPMDKIIWDVGHQSYVHKILTGRKDKFDTIRRMNGLSGFPKTNESEHDSFNTGHSSTSISAALGIAKARDIIKDDYYSVIAVIGDGALTGGMAFEALNDAGRSTTNMIVILNDNEMSISKNVGGLSRYLSKIRIEPIYFKAKEDLDIILNKIPAIGKGAAKAIDKAKGTLKYMIMPGIIFEELGFKYLGPIDGHNYSELCNVLTRAKGLKGPVLVHVCTQKGKGYPHAEENPHIFHGISPFEIETGEVLSGGGPNYSQVFGKELMEIAKDDSSVAAITAAMPQGTGLEPFSKAFPNRFFDVGIAEQHAVTFAAGLAKNGVKPVFAVYSSFLQRAYDQVVHDLAVQNLHVVLAIDRAGIVGDDGETHQGLFDLSFLSHIPNLTVMAPCDYYELRLMLRYAVECHDGPIALRYPRGKGQEKLVEKDEPIQYGKASLVCEGNDITIVAAGNMVETAIKVNHLIKGFDLSASIINIRFIKPLDSEMIIKYAKQSKWLFTIEDNIISGGLGTQVLSVLNANGIEACVKMLGFPDSFIEQGSKNDIMKKYKLDPEGIAEEVVRICSGD